ncbi:DUF1566 domain-containing protein [Oceanospirillum sediminis]|uniref:DUF1566 domain-containing protein n=1 Tax=Oceanospirillum sediminis TaxID=2760088 RepID=A0A839ILG7_9GAMM|nr:DUF1566 domain-containing protein [Oceanospirillum sediminis]MBB1485382.1 DUF1566 domain-containing protein [Oceanospirillum sediminis]
MARDKLKKLVLSSLAVLTTIPAQQSFASDDTFIVQRGVIGRGEGNDTYILSAFQIDSNAAIQIIDSQGNNEIQLIGGLSITSSQVAPDAILLNLSNGATVTILGAGNYSYISGGDPLTGITGQPRSHSDFVSSILGTSIPSSGINNGGTSTINSDGSADVTPADDPTDTPSTSQTYKIVDTNQSQCYNSSTGNSTSCTGSGMDADYSGNQPDYTVSSGGDTVTDNVTGITWTRSADTNNDGELDTTDKMSPTEAVNYCQNLTLNGESNWRLPDIKTAYSLIDFSGLDPSGYNGTDTSQLTPFLNSAFIAAFGDTAAGERIIDAQYATTTLYVSTTMNGDETMFGVNLVDGRIKGYPTSSKFYVLCATGNEDYGVNSFTDNNDGTISDSATGLMWHKNDTTSLGWEDAINTCEASSTAGHSDWRLPNIKELQSILDYTRSPDTTSSAAIDPVFSTTSFINEEGETDWQSYWSSTTHANYNLNGSSAAYMSFGRALGYINNTFMDVHGAGAQRSDNKVSPTSVGGATSGTDSNGETFYSHGPQGDILRNDHMVRCVRDI